MDDESDDEENEIVVDPLQFPSISAMPPSASPSPRPLTFGGPGTLSATPEDDIIAAVVAGPLTGDRVCGVVLRERRQRVDVERDEPLDDGAFEDAK